MKRFLNAGMCLPMTKKRAEINSRIENPESWVDQYGDFLYRFTLSRVKDPSIAEDKEFMDVLYRCIGELPERQAEAFMMREIDGFSTEEICKVLNICKYSYIIYS